MTLRTAYDPDYWDNLRAILTTFPGFGTFTGTELFLLETLRLGGKLLLTAPFTAVGILKL